MRRYLILRQHNQIYNVHGFIVYHQDPFMTDQNSILTSVNPMSSSVFAAPSSDLKSRGVSSLSDVLFRQYSAPEAVITCTV